jgi:hypothetical protein
MNRLRADFSNEDQPFFQFLTTRELEQAKLASREWRISSELFFICSGGNGRILWTYHLILPKFHLILPKYRLIPPKKFVVSSVEISDFFRGDHFLVRMTFWSIPFFVLHLPLYQ